MEAKIRKIQELKKEKNAVIMAHYYVPDEVQDIADYVGDSYYLSEMATKVDAEIIVLCGVSFKHREKSPAPGCRCRLPDGAYGRYRANCRSTGGI